MRRLMMILIAVGVIGSVAVVSSVNAAELFNTVKKKEEPAAVQKKPQQRSTDKAMLFNKKSSVDPLKSSGLSSKRSERSGVYTAGKIVVPVMPKRAFTMNEKWANYSMGARNANVERTQYALQLEQERRQNAAKSVAIGKQNSDAFIYNLMVADAKYLEKTKKQDKDWEELKRERRMALYGDQVNKAYGGNAFAPSSAVAGERAETKTDSKTVTSYGDAQSSTIKRERKIENKRSSGTQLFNNIE